MRTAARGALFAVVLLAEYWVPGLLGGDYGAGDYRWTVVRGAALALLVGIAVGGLWLARSLGVVRVAVGPGLIVASSVAVALSMMVAAAWVHVPPDSVLWIGAAVTLVPLFTGGRVGVALASTAAAAALVDFWMACVPPY